MTLEHNFPMALDEADHRLFVATHEPARLAVLDTNSGRSIAELPCVQDADEVYYTRGENESIFPGARATSACFNRPIPITTSCWPKSPQPWGLVAAAILAKGGKALTVSFWACLRRADHGAEIRIYTVQD